MILVMLESGCASGRIAGHFLAPKMTVESEEGWARFSGIAPVSVPVGHLYMSFSSLAHKAAISAHAEPLGARRKEHLKYAGWEVSIEVDEDFYFDPQDALIQCGGFDESAPGYGSVKTGCALRRIVEFFHFLAGGDIWPPLSARIYQADMCESDRRAWLRYSLDAIPINVLVLPRHCPGGSQFMIGAFGTLAHEYWHALVAEGKLLPYKTIEDEESAAHAIGNCARRALGDVSIESTADNEHEQGADAQIIGSSSSAKVAQKSLHGLLDSVDYFSDKSGRKLFSYCRELVTRPARK